MSKTSPTVVDKPRAFGLEVARAVLFDAYGTQPTRSGVSLRAVLDFFPS